MDFLEKDLEEIIFNADKAKLREKGLYINGKLLRQVRIGNYGKADLIEIIRSYNESELVFHNNFIPVLEINIFELKLDKIGISAFLQAIGYAKGIKRYLEVRKFKFYIKISIILIGKTIDKSSTFCYLDDILPCHQDASDFLINYTYSYNIDGIAFKQEYGFKLTNEGF